MTDERGQVQANDSWRQHTTSLKPYRMSDNGKGYVYLLRSEHGHIKIGSALNPTNRFKRLQKQYQFRWEVLAVLHSNHAWQEESYLHQHFRSQHVKYQHDWFVLLDSDIEYIKLYVGVRQ